MPTIRYQLTGQEVARKLLQHRQPSRLRSWARIILAVGGLALLVGARRFFDPGTAAIFLLLGGLMVLLAAVLLAADPLVVRHTYLRRVRRHPGPTEEKEIAFEEQGLVSTSPYLRMEMQWAAVLRLTQDEQYLRLYTEGTPVPITLLKRAFGPDELAAFLRCHEQAPKNPRPFLNVPSRPILRDGGSDGLPDNV